MSALREYWYDEQLKRYLVQFMAIFADMLVRVGWTDDKEPRYAKTPIFVASKDRVVAAIKAENTQNKLIRFPLFTARITNFDPMPERRKGIPTVRRNTIMPTGGLFPDDLKVVQQRMPVPYKLTLDLGIWVSNMDQHFQILEQIMMLFNPTLQIQRSEEITDWTMITSVEHIGTSPEENYPAGTDRRLINTTMTFEMPIHISAPVDVHDKYIKDIFIRVGAVSQSAVSNFDMVGELDSQGVPYELIFSLDDIDLE